MSLSKQSLGTFPELPPPPPPAAAAAAATAFQEHCSVQVTVVISYRL
jgi:hypothetical protein